MSRITLPTYCRICEALCGLSADVENGEVQELRPDPDHPVSRGFACVKGMRFLEVHRDPDRLRHPMRKNAEGAFERIGWERAIAEIGDKLGRIRREHGPDSVAIYFGNPAAFSYQQPIAVQALQHGLGTRNVFSAGSQDCNDKFVVGRAMYGSSLLQPVPDLERCRFLLLIGTNPAVSQMSFVHAPRAMERIKAIVARGGRVVLVDPRRNETAQNAAIEHRFVRPDTDVFLLAAIAKRIVTLDYVDREATRRHMRGYERLAQALSAIDVAACAEVTGVSIETIDDLAHALGTTTGAAIHLSTGVNQGTAGALTYWLAQCVLALTGNLDRSGGVVFPEHLVDLPRLMKLARLEESGRPSRIGRFEPVLGTLPATILPDEILTEGKGRIRALVVFSGNPVLSCANSARMRSALGRLDLLVSLDLYRNETAELGHYALPGLDFLQREDFPLAFLTTQPEPFMQWTDAVARPLGEERSEWDVVVDLCRAARIPLFGVPFLADAIAASRRLGSLDPAHPRRGVDALLRLGGSSLSALRAHPHGMLREPNRPGSFLGQRVLTSDGRVDLAPERFVVALERLEPIRRRKLEQQSDGRTLLLFSKREKTSHNSWLHNVPSFVAGRRKTNYAFLHPDDAEARGIADGARIRIHNAWGEIELPARLDPDVVRGGIAIPHGWGHASARSLRTASATEGVDVNRLAPDGPAHTDRLSGMTQLVGIPVEVEAVERTAEAAR